MTKRLDANDMTTFTNQPTKKRLLIVEDEPLVAQYLSLTLKGLGYDSLPPVGSGEEALECIEKEHPDVILMDISLSGNLDGIDTVEKISQKYSVPVIYLTASNDLETVERAKNRLVFGYLTKPVDPKQLRSSIEIALHKYVFSERLYANNEWFLTIMENISEIIIVMDERGAILYANSNVFKLVDTYPVTSLRPLFENQTLYSFPEDRRINSFEAFLEYLRKGGEKFEYRNPKISTYFLADLTPLNSNDENKRFLLTLRNINTQIQNEAKLIELTQQLRDLHDRVVNVQEKERLYLAREIHDDLAQSLVRIKMDLAFVKQSKELSPVIVQQLDSTLTLVDDSVKRVKRIARNLRPIVLDQLGLKMALDNYIEEMKGKAPFAIHTNFSEFTGTFVKEWELDVYRVFQEGLTNVMKHAVATHVWIRIAQDEKKQELHLEIKDNGSKFTSFVQDHSYGILGMKERARKWGGTVSLLRKNNHTYLVLNLPFPPL